MNYRLIESSIIKRVVDINDNSLDILFGISNVRIQNIYFGAYSVKTGGIINGCRIFDYTQHKPVIIGGIKEMECTKILQDFL